MHVSIVAVRIYSMCLHYLKRLKRQKQPQKVCCCVVLLKKNSNTRNLVEVERLVCGQTKKTKISIAKNKVF